MPDRNERKPLAWWEGALPDTERELRAFLVRRLPALRSQHDDLVNDTLLDLAQRVRARDGMPESWYAAASAPIDEASRGHFVRLAMTILRRRVADGFRGTAKRWATRATDAALETTATDAPDPTRAAHVGAVLRACIETLADASDHDRELLLSAAGVTARDGHDVRAEDQPLTPRDRQRLKRLRDRLAATIRERFGDDVATLLRDDD